MNNTQKIYWPFLDGLRGFSVILVIISHLRFFGLTRTFGGFGVLTFFAISGFMITTVLLNEKNIKGFIDLKKFYFRRIFRIIPALFLYLFVLFILNNVYDLNISKIDFISHLFFFDNIPNSISHFNISKSWYLVHLWTLTIEMQFYLIYTFLISRLNLKIIKKLIVGSLIFVPIIHYCYYHKVGYFFSSHILRTIMGLVLIPFSYGTIVLLSGSYFAILNFQKSNFISWLRSSNRSYFLKPILIYFISFLLVVPIASENLDWFWVVPSAIFLNILIILITDDNNNSSFKRILESKFLVTIGGLSYSIYLWQQIFVSNQPWKNSFLHGDSIILNLLLCAIVSYFSSYYYEKWFINFKKRIQ
jgi:peptidoglycan/LPS O-acetylase OafA/YrhL